MSDKKLKSFAESAEEFHAAMGRCIATWAVADQVLFEIFQYCVGPPKQCAIIFYKQPGLDQRLTLTTEIVLSLLPQPTKKDGGHPHLGAKAWKEIDKKFHDLLAVRRRIAHQNVRADTTHEQAEMETIVRFAFEILPGYGEQLRGRSDDHAPLGIDALIRHDQDVARLVQALFRFQRRKLRRHVQASSPPDVPPKAP
jgi:hypothetical protein